MAELHETRMGKTLIDHTFPKIAKQLERIADTLGYIENSFTHNNGKENKGIVDALELISDALELKNQVDALLRARLEEHNKNEHINRYEKLKKTEGELTNHGKS